MAKFKFIGRYSNGHTSNTVHGVTFVGNEPSEVTDEEAIRRLSGNVEFEALDEGPAPLAGKNKAQLLEIAAEEGVELVKGATNKEIVAAISAARGG